jgi:hypothetical protein
MTTNSDQTLPGSRPAQQLSGLIEDRPSGPLSIRQRVDTAASTLLALIKQLPEHGKEDTDAFETATTSRLFNLHALLNEHLSA